MIYVAIPHIIGWNLPFYVVKPHSFTFTLGPTLRECVNRIHLRNPVCRIEPFGVLQRLLWKSWLSELVIPTGPFPISTEASHSPVLAPWLEQEHRSIVTSPIYSH